MQRSPNIWIRPTFLFSSVVMCFQSIVVFGGTLFVCVKPVVMNFLHHSLILINIALSHTFTGVNSNGMNAVRGYTGLYLLYLPLTVDN